MFEIFDLKNAFNRYVLLWAIPQFLGLWLGSSSAIALLFSIPYLILTIYYFFMSVKKRKLPSSLKILLFLFLFLVIYGVFDLIGYRRYTFLQAIVVSIPPIFVFYEFFCSGKVTEKLLKQWFFVFLVLAIWTYFKHQMSVMELSVKRLDASEVVNNMSYILIGLFPFVFLFKNRYLQLGIIFVISYFTIIGLKRGAIVVLAIMILWYIISSVSTKRKGKFNSLLAMAVLIGLAYVFIKNQFITNDAFVHRLDITLEGDSSGRDEIYSFYWDYFLYDAPIFNKLFGGGAWFTEQLGHIKAHNDWLEMLIDHGAVGCIIYLLFWIGYWRDIRRQNRNNVTYLVGMACFIVSFCRTPFSMFYYVIHLYVSIMIAYSLTQYNIQTGERLKEQ